MTDILLATLNARYQHSSLGLRSLRANLGSLRERCLLREFGVSEPASEVAIQILESCPRVVGLGIYIF